MEIQTHQEIDRGLCGDPVELGDGYAVVEMTFPERTRADATGLVHGGFVFGLADYAAMLAVNKPTVVLAAAEVSFKKPVLAGHTVRARADIVSVQGKKHTVSVRVVRGDEIVFEGAFSCVVPERHVTEER
ncbi:MAG TPA: hotdog fold thioesterase [Spirochaetota bacterium]|nr:hotdog fold thioesterase [Spirochaetota bacterium]HRZ26717.1 hotdog fold thioesterase [Spirochaetota bacterium]HSA13480.1 hotdog fold thioesterase [Spirochaetota bacterium]